jgi:hypothetical protein
MALFQPLKFSSGVKNNLPPLHPIAATINHNGIGGVFEPMNAICGKNLKVWLRLCSSLNHFVVVLLTILAEFCGLVSVRKGAVW